jgi:two-component system, NtrC family, sensor kinase
MGDTNIKSTQFDDTKPGNLAELQAEVERLRNRLMEQENLANIGTNAAGIMHEIKNPLNFVINFSKLSLGLVDELDDLIEQIKNTLDTNSRDDLADISDTLRANIAKINENGQRAMRTMTTMLAQARGEKPAAFEKTDINQMVDESVKLAYQGVRALDSEFNVSLKTAYDATLGSVAIDAQDMSRVIINIVNNACYAVNEKKKRLNSEYTPQIAVTTQKQDGELKIIIRDNGPGMPREVMEKIFNPFFTTKPHGEGTGLGLSMSYDIITRVHGGRLDVSAEDGSFTEFAIAIPIK